ncbi:hypothetical protein IKF43_01700 [Candidatus Saccharibacteria bacterium]|nr:hypothetical protein [Candidatus Saccharibacteria bacterium]
MDNGQIPPVQPVQSMPPMQSAQVMPGMPMVQQVQMVPEKKKDVAGLVKTIAIIIVSLIAVAFIGLFIWMFVQYKDIQTDVEGQISVAAAEARDEQATKMEAEFLEREKYPYKTFSGPADYGQLTFEYPKTWSVYVAAAATNGGDFNAYFNPIQVDAVGKETINALRVTIRNKSFDDVVAEYQKAMDRKDSGLTVESVTIGKTEDGSAITANRYTGKIPNTELNGIIVIFKIRDKTAILQTDSVLFQEDFDKLLTTVEFNA